MSGRDRGGGGGGGGRGRGRGGGQPSHTQSQVPAGRGNAGNNAPQTPAASSSTLSELRNLSIGRGSGQPSQWQLQVSAGRGNAGASAPQTPTVNLSIGPAIACAPQTPTPELRNSSIGSAPLQAPLQQTGLQDHPASAPPSGRKKSWNVPSTNSSDLDSIAMRLKEDNDEKRKSKLPAPTSAKFTKKNTKKLDLSTESVLSQFRKRNSSKEHTIKMNVHNQQAENGFEYCRLVLEAAEIVPAITKLEVIVGKGGVGKDGSDHGEAKMKKRLMDTYNCVETKNPGVVIVYPLRKTE